MSRYALTWDPETALGSPLDVMCAVPLCGLPVKGQSHGARGLCCTCYMAWKRGGMEGLRARAARILAGARLQVPTDLDQAMVMLTDAYEDYTDALELRDPASPLLMQRLLKICSAVGSIERRKKWAEYTRRWRETRGKQAPGARGRGQKAV